MGAPDLWQVGLLCKEGNPGAPFGDDPGFHWNNNPQARKFKWFINVLQTFFQWLSTGMDWSGSSSFSQQKPGNPALPLWWTKDPRSSGRGFLGSHCLDLGVGIMGTHKWIYDVNYTVNAVIWCKLLINPCAHLYIYIYTQYINNHMKPIYHWEYSIHKWGIRSNYNLLTLVIPC